jgi:hypothetical protein
MKKQYLLIISAFALISILIVVVTSFSTPSEKNIISQKKSSELSLPYLYIIKDYEGKVSVFEKNKKEPIMITDVLVSSLPELDAKEMQKGIFINSKEELDSLIEDYIS